MADNFDMTNWNFFSRQRKNSSSILLVQRYGANGRLICELLPQHIGYKRFVGEAPCAKYGDGLWPLETATCIVVDRLDVFAIEDFETVDWQSPDLRETEKAPAIFGLRGLGLGPDKCKQIPRL